MNDFSQIRGSIVALVTPFKDGKVDEKSLRALVDWHIAEGTHGIVPMGTTGESPVVSEAEHEAVTEIVIDQAAGRVPVIAGTGSNYTAEAVHYTQHAAKAGADAALVVVPYYNKPSQAGMIAHFTAVANAAPGLPIIVYNVPGRTVADILPETVARLYHDVPNIIGIKDASAKLERASEHRLLCGPDFVNLSGEDGTALAFNAHGGRGCISVTANVAPRLCSEFQEATLRGDYAAALALQDKLYPLHKAVFADPSPVPSKYALSLMGRCEPEPRLPLIAITDAAAQAVRDAMRHAGLTN